MNNSISDSSSITSIPIKTHCAYHPKRGELSKVIGQCDTDDKYGHNYLNCKKCKVDKSLRCFINNCPCKGQGYLFSVKDDDKCFSHQLAGHLNSVRIYLNRPARTLDSIKNSIKKQERIINNRQSYMRHRSVLLDRIEDGSLKKRRRKPKNKAEDKQIISINTSAQDLNDSDKLLQSILNDIKSSNILGNQLQDTTIANKFDEEVESDSLESLLLQLLENESDEDEILGKRSMNDLVKEQGNKRTLDVAGLVENSKEQLENSNTMLW